MRAYSLSQSSSARGRRRHRQAPLPVTPEATYQQGVRVVMVEHVVRNHPDSVSPLIKSNNLINNALGMQQAIAANAAEAVFRNHRGELAECAQSNLFVVTGSVVKTPPLEAGLLAGITRAFVLDVGRAPGIAMEEVTANRVVGSRVPGPTTTTLLAEYRRRALAR
jgi:branched-subunit amino acid aminotransferase/4-amino-4-deoxychorismate lyase